ncbi:zinc ribbon domain-containing protein [Knoellia sp. CPCC 206450]|uniref:zinc ribbon domain-containing protein n=1 Tax=Knoellia tibetensis TaxID=3404798 RepID=UPI003B42C56F
MHCRSCGADLPVDAAFCTQCGARVELGSVLGVGTDLPAAPSREPARTPAEDLSQTRELPRIDPSAGNVHARPAPPAAAAPAPLEAPADDDTGQGHSRNSILAMVATFTVLTIIGTFALTRLLGPDDRPRSTSTSASSSPAAAEEAGDAQPAPSTSSPQASSSPEVSPSASSSIPAAARRCSTSGSDAVATAYAGTERTSCEFAAAVREAYRQAGSPGDATSLRAYSPVTKKWYSLSCDGGEPVRCTSTTNAIVYLAP